MDTVETMMAKMADMVNAHLPACTRINIAALPRVRLGMSTIQITAFVLNNKEFPTSFAKAHQAKVEIWHRLVDLMRYVFDSRKREIRAAMLKRDLEAEDDPLKQQLIEVKIAEQEFSRSVSEQWAVERSREIGVFWEVYIRHRAGDPDDPGELQRLELKTWQERMEIEPIVFAEKHRLDPARIASVVGEYNRVLPAVERSENSDHSSGPVSIRWADDYEEEGCRP